MLWKQVRQTCVEKPIVVVDIKDRLEDVDKKSLCHISKHQQVVCGHVPHQPRHWSDLPIPCTKKLPAFIKKKNEADFCDFENRNLQGYSQRPFWETLLSIKAFPYTNYNNIFQLLVLTTTISSPPLFLLLPVNILTPLLPFSPD